MSDISLGSILKAENMKLKKDIEELQETILRISGSIQIISSGVSNKKLNLISKVDEIIHSASTELKIVTPKVGKEFADILVNIAKKGIKIQVIINDRRFLTIEEEKKGSFSKLFAKSNISETDRKKEEYDYANIYDTLKTAPGIDLINNPNIKFLMIWEPNHVLLSGGWLERRILEKTILLGTYINDKNKVKELLGIYKELLPTFMR